MVTLFSFALFQEIIKDCAQLNIESDISLSLRYLHIVYHLCLRTLKRKMRRMKMTHGVMVWHDLKQHRNIAFSGIVGLNLSFWQILLKLTIS